MRCCARPRAPRGQGGAPCTLRRLLCALSPTPPADTAAAAPPPAPTAAQRRAGSQLAQPPAQPLSLSLQPPAGPPPRPGVLHAVPLVAPSAETLASALRRASRLTATPGMAPEASEAARGRVRAAKQVDGLARGLVAPLAAYVRGFPPPGRLHPFERALLDLTVGARRYEAILRRVDALRRAALELGKEAASGCRRAASARDAAARRSAAERSLTELWGRGGACVDDLKEAAKALRSLPVAELGTPTAALVGAPNVGKSSLVRLLSSGTPTVANYPFTTRGVAMGHVTRADGAARAVLTDTPGVLLRPDEARNRMERLTLATLAFLPCGVLFVADASGGCGVDAAGQLAIRDELLARFPGRPWLDVLSKWDVVPADPGERDLLERGMGARAVRVSALTGEGTSELAARLGALLRAVRAALPADEGGGGEAGWGGGEGAAAAGGGVEAGAAEGGGDEAVR